MEPYMAASEQVEFTVTSEESHRIPGTTAVVGY